MNKTRRKKARRATSVARRNGSQSRNFSGIKIYEMFTKCDKTCRLECNGPKAFGQCIHTEMHPTFNRTMQDDFHMYKDFDGYALVATYTAREINSEISEYKAQGYDYTWTNFAIDKCEFWSR